LAKVIEMPADIQRQLIEQARAALPNEACGLLAGLDGRVEHFVPARNADESPLTYRIDPKELFDAFNEIEEKGWELNGVFHSHTHTEAYPSETDQRQAYYPDAHYVLVSLADPSEPVVRAFTIVDGLVEEQEVRIV
jgi:proteasome lid subunit RPN8/RPN11